MVEQSSSPDTTGIVYVLANPAMPDYVKIGITQDLQDRMKSLDGTSVPVPFECVYAAVVQNPRQWEQTLHAVFTESRVNPRREFFDSDITAKAVRILKTAQIREVTPTAPTAVESDESNAQERIAELFEGKRSRFDFEMLDVPVGSTLTFRSDETITCEVINQRPPRVKFQNEEISLSLAAATALGKESSVGIQGPLYWNYDNEPLTERRDRREQEESVNG